MSSSTLLTIEVLATNSGRLLNLCLATTQTIHQTNQYTSLRIRFNAKTCASLFDQQFNPHPILPTKAKRSTLRKTKKLNHETSHLIPQVVENAIKASKERKAQIRDNIAPFRLHHLGQMGLSNLTNLINMSLNSSIIPQNWKNISDP